MKKTQEKKINEKLIEIVKERKVSLRTLGAAIGLKSFNNLYSWINGKLEFNFKTLEKIAGVLEVDIKIILEEK